MHVQIPPDNMVLSKPFSDSCHTSGVARTSIKILLLLRTGEEEMLRNYREKEKYLQYAVEGFFAYLLLFRTFFF